MPEVSVIIPAWNKWEFTRNCLESLPGTTNLETTEVIVVDNGSTDETPEGLKAFSDSIPNLKIIRNKENLGFARACNQGARAASGKYLVFLNNDTVATARWLEEMLRIAESDPTVGAVGSLLLYPDGSIQHAGVGLLHHQPFPEKTSPDFVSHLIHLRLRETPKAGEDKTPRLVPALTGASLLVPGEAFMKVGGFDEKFRNGFEDIDLCFRLRREGLKMIFCPASVLTHFESITPKRHAHEMENWHYLVSKWPGYIGGGNGVASHLQIPNISMEGAVWFDVTGLYLYHHEELKKMIQFAKKAGENAIAIVWDTAPVSDMELSMRLFSIKLTFVLPFTQTADFFKLNLTGNILPRRMEKRYGWPGIFSATLRPTSGFEEDFAVKLLRKIFRLLRVRKQPVEIPKGEKLYLLS